MFPPENSLTRQDGKQKSGISRISIEVITGPERQLKHNHCQKIARFDSLQRDSIQLPEMDKKSRL